MRKLVIPFAIAWPQRMRGRPTTCVPRWIPPCLAHHGRRGEGRRQHRLVGQFNDPVLDNLIHSALQENLDLQIASARVDEFAGRYGFVRADLFPRSGPMRRPVASRRRRRREHAPPGTNLTLNNYSATSRRMELDVWAASVAHRSRPRGTRRERGRPPGRHPLPGRRRRRLLRQPPRPRRQLEIAKETAKTRGESLGIFQLRFESGSPPRWSTSR